METFILRYGAPAVFLAAACEGDVVVLLAGVVAHLGLLDPVVAWLAVFLGLLTGDSVAYTAGRHGGARLRETALYRHAAPVIERLVGRAGVVEIVAARAVYGTRFASMIYWGIGGLPYPRFLAVDALGAALWTTALGGLGYALSDSAQRLIGDLHRVEHWLLGALVVAVVVVATVKLVTRRRVAPGATPPGPAPTGT